MILICQSQQGHKDGIFHKQYEQDIEGREGREKQSILYKDMVEGQVNEDMSVL